MDRRPDGWRVRLLAREPGGGLRGSRVLETDGDDCSVVRDAVVLAAVLIIDPEALMRPSAATDRRSALADPQSASPNSQPSAADPQPAPADPQPAPIPADVVRVVTATPAKSGTARLWTSVNAGTLPRPTVGFGLEVQRVPAEPWEIGAGFGLWMAQQSEGVDAGLAAGWLQGCWRPVGGSEVSATRSSWTVSACLRGYAGALRVSVQAAPELDPVEPGQYFWAAVAPVVGTTWSPIDALQLGLEVATPVSLTRQSFRIDGAEVYRENPIAVAVGFSLGWAI